MWFWTYDGPNAEPGHDMGWTWYDRFFGYP
jgi:hypothetical protein